MEIVGGEGLAAPMARFNAVRIPQQRFQLGLHLEHAFSAGPGQKPDLAEELDAGAESLFGSEKDPALAEGKFSQPEATAIATSRVRHACAFPAPFIFRKPAHQLAKREERQRQVRMRVGIVPVDDYCFFKTC